MGVGAFEPFGFARNQHAVKALGRTQRVDGVDRSIHVGDELGQGPEGLNADGREDLPDRAEMVGRSIHRGSGPRQDAGQRFHDYAHPESLGTGEGIQPHELVRVGGGIAVGIHTDVRGNGLPGGGCHANFPKRRVANGHVRDYWRVAAGGQRPGNGSVGERGSSAAEGEDARGAAAATRDKGHAAGVHGLQGPVRGRTKVTSVVHGNHPGRAVVCQVNGALHPDLRGDGARRAAGVERSRCGPLLECLDFRVRIHQA